MTGRGEHGVIRWMRVTVNRRVTVTERALSRGRRHAGAPTCDASRGQRQAERDVVLVVAHLSQEFKFQLTQDLAVAEKGQPHQCAATSGVNRNPARLWPWSLTGYSCSYLAVCCSDHVDEVAN